MVSSTKTADICLILEGTYPYVSGGVSTWTHELIKNHHDLTFSLLCILAPEAKRVMKYELPPNVINHQDLFLQKLKEEDSLNSKERKQLFDVLERAILMVQHKPSLEELSHLILALKKSGKRLSKKTLLNSVEAWNMLVRVYRSAYGATSFLNFFWSWRGLLAGMFSILLADIPDAKVYHAVSTGYAGLFLSRAYLERGRPALITEHGIYTNERRIEIIAANWLDDEKPMSLHVDKKLYVRDLKDLWIDSFTAYSKLSYAAATKVVTLFEGNKEFQLADGASEEQLMIIPNGVDFDHYSSVVKDQNHPPTVALIGRVVPIKDIKSFIRAVSFVTAEIPDLKALIIGPTDEDEEYYEECLDLIKINNLQDVITFTGKVNISDYLPKIDVLALTSISESQPLVILEAGSAMIPSVTTDVGGCKEMIMGRSDEDPPLGVGGGVCTLSNPKGVADSIIELLTNEKHYNRCGKAIQERVKKYYHVKDQRESYDRLYHSLINQQAHIYI